jgi:hypothetical protein
MRQVFLNTAAAASLTLAVAIAAWWARSYSRFDCVQKEVHNGRVANDFSSQPFLQVSSGNGRVFVCYSPWHLPEMSQTRWVRYAAVDQKAQEYLPGYWATQHAPPSGWSFAGFIYYDFMGQSSRLFAVPLYFAVAVALAAPSIRFYQIHRTRRRLRFGRCNVCGYDLRATPMRCPECGTAARAAA